MIVAVACATPAARRRVVPAVEDAGHDVVAVDRAVPLDEQLTGCDALVVLAPSVPVGAAARSPRAWRRHDHCCSAGVQELVATARAAGVRRVVQQSFSYVYADQGADWVTEESPVCVTAATESASVGELAVQDYTSSCRTGVVLRMGQVVGDSGGTRWTLRAASRGRPVGTGAPDGYAHLIHSDDVGPAVAAALEVPSGVYNVGAEPVRRDTLVRAYARAVGRTDGGFLGPLTTWLAGERSEPLARSLRVSSDRFRAASGWTPQRGAFSKAWLDAADVPQVAVR